MFAAGVLAGPTHGRSTVIAVVLANESGRLCRRQTGNTSRVRVRYFGSVFLAELSTQPSDTVQCSRSGQSHRGQGTCSLADGLGRRLDRFTFLLVARARVFSGRVGKTYRAARSGLNISP